MKSTFFLFMLILINDCFSQEFIDTWKPNLGNYTKCDKNVKGFQVKLKFNGFEYSRKIINPNMDIGSRNYYILSDTVLNISIEFNNNSDSIVIIDVPLGWYNSFLNEPIIFGFNDRVRPNIREERFFLNKDDTLKRFFRKFEKITIKPYVKYSINGIIDTSSIYDIRSNKLIYFNNCGTWIFKISYYYLYTKNTKINEDKYPHLKKVFQSDSLTININ